jgi:trimeric autotransporter adhesin
MNLLYTIFRFKAPTVKGILYILLALFFTLKINAQTTMGSITTSTSPGCKMTFNICSNDEIRLRPTDMVNYTNFKWYSGSVALANEINAAAVTAGDFNILTSSSLPVITIKAPTTAQTLTYIVTAEYATPSGCAAKNDTIELKVFTLPTVAIAETDVSCTSDDGKIISGSSATLTASGGTSYVWDNGLSAGAVQSVSPTSTTTYNVTVTDVNGCKASASSTITLVTAPTAAIAETDGSCTSDDGKILSGGSATLTASGGTSYAWDNGLGSGAVKTASPTSTTIYTVTVSDANGCTSTASNTVTIVNAPNFTLTQATVCPGEADYVQILSLTNAVVATSQTKVNTGAYFAYPTPANITAAKGLIAGSNTIAVKNADGCETAKTVTVTLTPAASCIPLIIEKMN